MATITINGSGFVLGSSIGIANTFALSKSASNDLFVSLSTLKSKTNTLNIAEISDILSRTVVREHDKTNAITVINQKLSVFLSDVASVDAIVAKEITKHRIDFLKKYSYLNSSSSDLLYGFVEKLDQFFNSLKKTVAEWIKNISEWCIEKWNEICRIIKEMSAIHPFTIDGDDTIYRNENDQYGTRQHGPLNTYKDNTDNYITNRRTEREYIERIVYENTGKHLTDQQMINYLDNNLNHNGCGYAAVTNCIFEYYSKQENGEQLFMEKFGFPMKDLNGNYTFNLLITYIFSKYSDYNNPQGLNQDTLKKVLASCMNSKDSSKNVNLKISNNQKITPQNIDDHLRNGDQVVLLGWNVPVYVLDSNGKVERTQICGGHGMVITGVTEDGKYIVSTWGKKAIVDPADIGKTNVKGKCKVSFTVVKY